MEIKLCTVGNIRQRERVNDPLIGIVLQKRFEITKLFSSEGGYGELYLALDFLTQQEVIIKMTQHPEMNYKEHQIMAKLNEYQFNKNFPKVYGGGTFSTTFTGDLSFIAMEKLGHTLKHYLFKQNKAFSLQTVCQIGIQLIEALNKIHQIGYVHNDLKLENILVGDQNGQDLHLIRLIDFGLSSSYLDQYGNHIPEEPRSFSGNIAFGSKYALQNIVPTRRDDLISLVYLLFYMHTGSLSFLNIDQRTATDQEYALAKAVSTAESMCQDKKSAKFLEFVKEIYNLGFSEKPDYCRLQVQLMNVLIEKNKMFSKEYDWSPPQPQLPGLGQIIQQEDDDSNTNLQSLRFSKALSRMGMVHQKIQQKFHIMGQALPNDPLNGSQENRSGVFDQLIQHEQSSQGYFEGGAKSSKKVSDQSVSDAMFQQFQALSLGKELKKSTFEEKSAPVINLDYKLKSVLMSAKII